MKAIVTGATGFIGSAVARRLLSEGIAVRALVRPNSADPKTSELLLTFELPKGKSTRTLTYELLP